MPFFLNLISKVQKLVITSLKSLQTKPIWCLNFKLVWILWVREVYNPAQTLSGPRARAKEVVCRGRMIEGRGVKGNG